MPYAAVPGAAYEERPSTIRNSTRSPPAVLKIFVKLKARFGNKRSNEEAGLLARYRSTAGLAVFLRAPHGGAQITWLADM